ncbi:hypothetical protein T492DRAFT_1109719 [Pavlovales sp. CCMP2436]|nr:hypothetical protein T492DRAFT_1109719 [Pavlovales sp. CCMP2436]|mmetsp:Transcript_36380/g.90758  ORF Transcript_36380/g.90758 Transcript_36380/m.90758 type:complete len:461 (+) Transcript_36380:230-1612(+)
MGAPRTRRRPATLAVIAAALAPLGASELPTRFHVAPMQVYTNSHLRALLRALSPSAVLWTEMEKTDDLLARPDVIAQRLRHACEQQPLVLQLGGNEPRALAEAARRAAAQFGQGLAEVNINCGCPSIETGGANYGASLMRDPALTLAIVDAVAAACPGLPVSVKCRLGVRERWGGEEAAATTQPDSGWWPERDDYDALLRYVRHISSSGALSHVVLHARAAVFAGLSPAQNRNIPPLRPEWAHRLARDVAPLRVTLNGGVGSLADLRIAAARARAATAAGEAPVNGVMAGRWLLRRPLDLAAVDAALLRPPSTPNAAAECLQKPAVAVEAFGRYAARALSAGEARAAVLAVPLLLVAEQLLEDTVSPAGEECRLGPRVVSDTCAAAREAVAVLRATGGRRRAGDGDDGDLATGFGLADPDDPERSAAELRKLAKEIAKISGTKVAGKVVRNRSEQRSVAS